MHEAKMNYSQSVCVLSARVDRGSNVESNQQASRLQTHDNQGTLCVRPYLNLIVLQQTMTEKMVIVLGDIYRTKKIGSLYHMIVSATAGILQWELVLLHIYNRSHRAMVAKVITSEQASRLHNIATFAGA